MPKKLNKSETEKWAFQKGVEDAKTSPLTVTEREVLTYEQRREMARTACKSWFLNNDIPGQSYYPDAASDSYESGWTKAFYAPIAELEGKRKRWRETLSGITVQQANEKIRELLKAMNIRGARYSDDMVSSIQVTRSWGIDASIYLRWDREYDSRRGIENPDDPKQRAGHYDFSVEVNWGSTGRSLSEAMAAAHLYIEIINYAAEIKAVMDRERVVWTWGIPEKTPEALPV
jgi:hypothetical protein